MRHLKRGLAARRSPNRLLASLPAADYRRLLPVLEPVSLPFRHILLKPGGAFEREMNRRGPFSKIINRYAQGFLASLIQSVACNALHSVEERCARWLLITRDRVGRNEFPMTQDLLAVLLGVRRPSVTLAVGAFRRARLIRYRHKRLLILDRAGLEAASCECYTVLKKSLARLLA